MKEIKAYIRRHRIADVVHALENAGFPNLCVMDVKGFLHAMSKQEQEYSIEIGEKVITEARLELICEDSRAKEAVKLISDHAQTGQSDAGWIFIGDISTAIPIGHQTGDATETPQL